MKRTIILLMFILPISILSQIPQTITWQGIIQDANGNNLDGNYNITVKLFETATEGTAVWTEIHNSVLITDGVANLSLGSVTPFNLNFSKQYWLEITVGSGTPMPRIKLQTVPYSLYSGKTSGVIQNDSLVLKDAQGVTRMVLNPNTGTFKMMNNDTVWYSLNVNSPLTFEIWQNTELHNKRYVDKDGYMVTEYTDKKNNKMLYKVIESVDPFVENVTTTLKYNSSGELIIKEEEFSYPATGGGGLTTTIYENEIETKRITKRTNGHVTTPPNVAGETTTTVYVNGTLVSFTKGSIYNNNISTCSPEYGETYKSTNEQTEDGTSLKHSQVDNYYNQVRNPGSTGGYKIGLGSDNKTVTQGFTFDEFGGVQANPSNGYPFTVQGNLAVNGSFSATGDKKFRIEHPSNNTKYLQHASIESNKVLNKYIGKIITDNDGVALVTLPDYFHDININFHYQLTVIGDFAQAIISKEIENGTFEIKTDKPNIKVSWEVTAERNDSYMRDNPFQDVINK